MKQNHSLTRHQWFEYVKAYEASGETQKAFCKTHDLSVIQFHYYRKCYLKAQNKAVAKLKNFVAITPEAHDVKPFRVSLKNEIKVSIPQRFDPKGLEALMQVLSAC